MSILFYIAIPPYFAPEGDEVDFLFTGGYSPPAGDSVDFDFDV